MSSVVREEPSAWGARLRAAVVAGARRDVHALQGGGVTRKQDLAFVFEAGHEAQGFGFIDQALQGGLHAIGIERAAQKAGAADLLVEHPAGHLREVEDDGRHRAEEPGTHEHVVEVRDDEHAAVHVLIDRHITEVDAGDPADDLVPDHGVHGHHGQPRPRLAAPH